MSVRGACSQANVALHVFECRIAATVYCCPVSRVVSGHPDGSRSLGDIDQLLDRSGICLESLYECTAAAHLSETAWYSS